MYRNMAQYYDDIFPAEDKIRFLTERFAPFRGGKLLDVGCSNGRVAKGLCGAGFAVTAIDLNDAMIEAAAGINTPDGAQVIAMDMLEAGDLFRAGSFDGIYCIGNTLVHLDGSGAVRRALEGFRRILKPGGRLVIQILDYEQILETRPASLPLIENERVRFERNYVYGSDRIEFRTTLTVFGEGEARFTGSEQLYPLMRGELERILNDAGFAVEDRHGGFRGAPYRKGAAALIVTAV